MLMQPGPERHRLNDFNLGIEKLVEALTHRCLGEITLRQLDEKGCVACFARREIAVELGEVPIEPFPETAKPLASAGFDDPRHQKPIEQVDLGASTHQREEPRDVDVLHVGSERAAARGDDAVDPAKVIELFAREVDHRLHEGSLVGVMRCERHGGGRCLAFAGRVILQEERKIGAHGR